MTRGFIDPTPEQQHVVLIDTATRGKAEQMIESCERCNLDEAEISVRLGAGPGNRKRSKRDGLCVGGDCEVPAV